MSDERKATAKTEAQPKQSDMFEEQPQPELANEELEEASGGGSLGRDVLIGNFGNDLGEAASDGEGLLKKNLTITDSTISGNSTSG